MVEITKKYIFRQSLWIFLLTALTLPLGYLIKILYVRTFSIEEFGLIFSIIGLITLVSIFNDLGFSETLKYYATRFYEKKQYSKIKESIMFAFLVQGSIAIILSLAFWFLAPIMSKYYFKSPEAIWALRTFLLYFIFLNLSKPLIQLFQATHNYLFYALSEFIRQTVILGLSALILFFPN